MAQSDWFAVMARRAIPHRSWALCIFAFVVCGCGSSGPPSINLMPAPEVYTQSGMDPFAGIASYESAPYHGILYVTDRAPSDNPNGFYLNKRGNLIRMGIGRLEVGANNFFWEEARKISLLKNRPGNYPLKIKSAEEKGCVLQIGLQAGLDHPFDGVFLFEQPPGQAVVAHQLDNSFAQIKRHRCGNPLVQNFASHAFAYNCMVRRPDISLLISFRADSLGDIVQQGGPEQNTTIGERKLPPLFQIDKGLQDHARMAEHITFAVVIQILRGIAER